jgi:hypothetical protein
MPKATQSNTMPLAALPAEIDFPGAIDRFRAIATASVTAMVTEGPVSPDRVLLDACADALSLLRRADAATTKRQVIDRHHGHSLTPEQRERSDELFREAQLANRHASHQLAELRKIRALTAAGIYAKALCVRQSVTGASHLAMSLARDLTDNDALRRLLWANDAEVTP